MKRSHRCTSNRSRADNLDSIFMPAEMFIPLLGSWIKERMRLTSFRVDAAHFVTFVPIAERAREPEIAFIVASILRCRNDMLDVEGNRDEGLWALAVAAAVA